MASSATTRTSDRPKAARRDAAERKASNGGRTRRPRSRAGRYAIVHDTKGPKIRLGLAWFLLAAVAILVGPLPTALLYGTVAAVAAAQTARTWQRRRQRPNELVAAAMAGAMALGACLGAGGAGLAILGGVGAAGLLALGDAKSKAPLITDIGWTLQCALPPGIAAMSMVLLSRLDQGSAIGLLLLVSAYEIGDFLIGSGARNPYEGPAAGGAAMVVITFILSTLPISALSFAQAWAFGGAVLLLAPLGQILASAILPAARAPASALRRLDSLLLTAPLWCFGVGIIIERGL